MYIYLLSIKMLDYEWDNNKAQKNLSKHGVAFADAFSVFEDDHALTVEDDHPHEQRYVILGKDAKDRLLVVVFTYRGELIRIISTRKATPNESKQYYMDIK